MKHIIIFIGLKIIEIAAGIFLPYWIGKQFEPKEIFFRQWLLGFGICLLSYVMAIALWVYIPLFIKFNWQKAKKLAK